MKDVVCVLTWFDEEQTCPGDHVTRLPDGRFEAVVVDDDGHRSIGAFDLVEVAVAALARHCTQADHLRHWWPEPSARAN